MVYVAFDACYAHPLPEGHRFPMLKYELLPRQLLHEGTCGEDQFFRPNRIDYTHVLRAHTDDYLDKLLNLSLTAKEVAVSGKILTRSYEDASGVKKYVTEIRCSELLLLGKPEAKIEEVF